MDKDQESIGPFREDTEHGQILNRQWRQERNMNQAQTKQPIPLRMREPVANATPSPGQRDTIAEALDAIREAVRAIPSDPYVAKLAPLIVAAQNAAVDVHDFHWKLADDFLDQRQAVEGFIAAAREQAVATTPSTGWGSPADYEAAVARARAKVSADADASVVATVVNDSTKARAQSLAESWIAALEALSQGIDSAYADWTGPSAMREGAVDLSRIQKIGSVEHTVRAYERPAKKCAELFVGYVERGEDDRADLLIEGSRPVLLELRDTSPVKLQSRWPSRPAIAEDERQMAFRLLNEFESYQQSRMPASIKAANDLLNQLRGIFFELVGTSPKFLSTSAFALAHLSGVRRPDSATPWQLDDAWVQRYLPSSANSFRLPGWTPTVTKSSMTNVRVRAPKGG